MQSFYDEGKHVSGFKFGKIIRRTWTRKQKKEVDEGLASKTAIRQKKARNQERKKKKRICGIKQKNALVG